MTLADYLALILETHARVLGYLAKEMGESTLMKILDETLDRHITPVGGTDDRSAWREPEGSFDSIEAYNRLEAAVAECGLPPHLADHLWSYPHFRRFIEGSLDLGARPAGRAPVDRLAEEAVDAWHSWLVALPVSAEIRDQSAAELGPELVKFRAAVLRAGGRRPLAAADGAAAEPRREPGS